MRCLGTDCTCISQLRHHRQMSFWHMHAGVCCLYDKAAGASYHARVVEP